MRENSPGGEEHSGLRTRLDRDDKFMVPEVVSFRATIKSNKEQVGAEPGKAG